MNTIRGIAVVITTTLLLATLGCTAARPPVRVGMSPSYPPLVFIKDNKPDGIEPTLARIVSKQLERDFVIETTPFNQLIPALLSGKIDVIMTGMSITSERQRLVNFTDSYMSLGQMLLVREKDIGRFPGALQNRSADVRLAVERDTTGEQYAVNNFPGITLTRFDSTEAAVKALESGGVDCFIHDAPTIWRFSADFATQHTGLVGIFEPLTDEKLAWAVRKDDSELLRQLNAELARMKREGILQEVIGNWIKTKVLVGSPEK